MKLYENYFCNSFVSDWLVWNAFNHLQQMLTLSTNYILCYVLMIFLAPRCQYPLNKWEWDLPVTCLGAFACWAFNMHNTDCKVRRISVKFLRRFIISDIFMCKNTHHDDVIKWKLFRVTDPLRGSHRSPVNSPQKVPVRRTVMFPWYGFA